MLTNEKSLVYIIILNWNTWQETIACLDSVFKLNYPSIRILICDNSSSNGSISRIASWLDGEIPGVSLTESDSCAHLIRLPAEKPIRYLQLTEAQLAEAGYEKPWPKIIQNAHNHGYAGGNNVGIQYAIKDSNCAAVWILNNDVLVTPDSLHQAMLVLNRTRGIVGSQVLDYFDGSLQSRGGGRYNKFTGKIKKVPPELPHQSVDLDYVSGCAMLVPKSLFLDVGLLCTDYFLYYEEMDLAIRAKAYGYSLFYAGESIVYHKGSATIGTSVLADFYQIRSRLAFSRRHFSVYYPFVFLSVCVSACVRVFRGQWKWALMIIHLLLDNDMSYDASRWRN